MTLDTTRKLLSSVDRGRVAAGGRDIGGLLATAPPPVVSELRRVVDQVQRDASDDYGRGFAEALEMVLAGFTREREHGHQVAADRDLIHARRHWRELLAAIERGTVRPRKLAEALGVPESTVSKALDGLESAGFIEPAGTAADRRGRPRRLTLRARVALGQATSEPVAPIRSVVASVIDCVASLADRHRGSRHELAARMARTLGPELGATALAAFVDALHDSALGHLEPDDAIVATGLEHQRLLEACLAAALREDRELPQLAALAAERPLVVRATHDHWDVLVARRGWPGVSVVRDDDLGRAPALLPHGYQVLYESPILAVHDQRDDAFRFVIDRAERRLVLTPGVDREPPPGFDALDTRAVFEAAA